MQRAAWASSYASNDPDPTMAVIHRRQESIMIHVLPSSGTVCIDCISCIDCTSYIDCTSCQLHHTHAPHACSTHTCSARMVDRYMLDTHDRHIHAPTHGRHIHASHTCSTHTCFTHMFDTYMLHTHGRHIHDPHDMHDSYEHARDA